MAEIGRLKIQCFNGESYIPVDQCKITVNPSSMNQEDASKYVNIVLTTDSSGLSQVIDLAAPP